MSAVLNWSFVREFVGTCKAAGIEPPLAVGRALHLLDVGASTIPDPTGPLLGLTDPKLVDRIEQLSIREHHDGRVGYAGMRPGFEIVSEQLTHELRDAVVPQLDAIVKSLQPRFAEYAKPLEIAARDFGLEATSTADDLLDRDDFAEAGAAMRAARAAWFAIQPIVSLRIEMARVFKLDPTAEQTRGAGHVVLDDGDINYSVCFAGEGWSLDPDLNHVAGNRRSQTDWFALARNGLRLNSVSEVAAKLKARGIKPSKPTNPTR